MLRDRCPLCLFCLSVTLVYCGQTVGWIKIPLGTEVGVGPGHIVLDGDPAPPRKGAQQSPIFGPCLLLWPNSWMDQDTTWYGGRPRPRRYCVRWGSGSPRKGAQQLPTFWPCLLWPNGHPSQQQQSSCKKACYSTAYYCSLIVKCCKQNEVKCTVCELFLYQSPYPDMQAAVITTTILTMYFVIKDMHFDLFYL